MNLNINDFSGPLDLLLHMVKRHEMDIYEIDIKIIIDEYIQGEAITQSLLHKLKPEDTLVVENVLSLGKNINEIVSILQKIASCKVNLCLAEENISFNYSSFLAND